MIQQNDLYPLEPLLGKIDDTRAAMNQLAFTIDMRANLRNGTTEGLIRIHGNRSDVIVPEKSEQPMLAELQEYYTRKVKDLLTEVSVDFTRWADEQNSK